MSTAIARLEAEHQIILGVLDALDRFVGSPDNEPAQLAEFVEFLADYADRLHHAKEEDILFATMVEHGFPRETGPVAVMLHEHDAGRQLVAQMRQTSQRSSWAAGDRTEVGRVAREFASLLRQHIAKEDQILYPMAQSRLPEGAIATLDKNCAAADAANPDLGRLESLGRKLAGA